jgi:hypothetical protein
MSRAAARRGPAGQPFRSSFAFDAARSPRFGVFVKRVDLLKKVFDLGLDPSFRGPGRGRNPSGRIVGLRRLVVLVVVDDAFSSGTGAPSAGASERILVSRASERAAFATKDATAAATVSGSIFCLIANMGSPATVLDKATEWDVAHEAGEYARRTCSRYSRSLSTCHGWRPSDEPPGFNPGDSEPGPTSKDAEMSSSIARSGEDGDVHPVSSIERVWIRRTAQTLIFISLRRSFADPRAFLRPYAALARFQ